MNSHSPQPLVQVEKTARQAIFARTIGTRFGTARVSTRRDKAFSAVVLLLLFGMLGWYVCACLAQRGWANLPGSDAFFELQGSSPAFFQGPDEGRFLSGIFQEYLEKAAQQRFPFYADVVKIYRRIERCVNGWSLTVLPREWSPVRPVGGRILALPAEDRLVQTPELYDPKNERRMVERADYYAGIAQDHPLCRLFLVVVAPPSTWLAVSRDYWAQRVNILSGDSYLRKFESLLPDGITYTWIGKELQPSETLTLYFRTDHHLSMRGAYMGYKQIVQLIRSSDPSVGFPLEARQWQIIPGVLFRGTYARRAGGLEDYTDTLEEGEFELPAFQVESSGPKGDPRRQRESYQNGSAPNAKFANHYAGFCGRDYGLVKYKNALHRTKNVLVVGDSYDNCLEDLLAFHYNESYFVDLRSYNKEVGEPFSISDFIHDHNIDHILFIGDPETVLGIPVR